MGASPAGRADLLIGRDGELAALRRALEAAVAGSGSVALVSGEPGIGKSALCTALAQDASAAGVAVRWGRCSEVDGAPAFWPWRQVLGRWPERPAEVDRFSFLDEAARAVLDEAAPAGALVVVEDLHWADEDSAMLLGHLAGLVPTHRLLLVATYRPDAVDVGGPLERAIATLVTGALVLPLAGLDMPEVEALLRATSERPAPGATVADVAARSDGNPFFVTQLARSWSLDATTAVPHGVRALVRSRLLGVEAAHLDVLRVAAAIGRTFDVGEVAAVAGHVAPVAVDAALRRHLLVPAGRPGRYRFTHALVREVLEDDTDEATRSDLHRRLLERLEATTTDDPEILATRARHALGAEAELDGGRVAAHVIRAAMAAEHSGGAREAIRLCRRGLAGRPSEAQRIELLVLLGRALFAVDELQESERTLLAAADLAERAGDHIGAARALLEIGSGRLVLRFDPSLGDRLRAAHDRVPAEEQALRALLRSRFADFADDRDEAEIACREAFASSVRGGDPEAIVQTGVRLLLNGCAWMPMAERRQVIERMDEALVPGAPRELEFNTAAMRFRLLLEEGALDDAVATGRTADEVFRGLSVMLHLGDPAEATVAIARGQLARAVELDAAMVAEAARRGVRELLDLATAGRQSAIARERDGGRSMLPLVEGLRRQVRSATGRAVASQAIDISFALALAENGEADAAADVVDDLLESDLERTSRGWGGNDMGMTCLLVEVLHHLRLGAPADRLLAIVSAVGDRNVVVGMPPMFLLGHGAHFTGLCHHLAGRLDEALADLHRARTANRAMRAVGPLVRTHLAIAAVLVDSGDGAAAVAQLRQAARALEGTELDHLRAQVTARLRSLGAGTGDGGHGGTTTFVFTDIVDSTARTRAAGDRAWRGLLEQHTSLVRALALRHAGRLVKALGDGYLLTFASARSALDFAAALQRDPRTAEVGVRIGVHTGEAEEVDGDPIGHHVNLAARVAAAAGRGEVLVSETVHALVSAEGDLRFGPARVEGLKGVGDAALRPLLLDA